MVSLFEKRATEYSLSPCSVQCERECEIHVREYDDSWKECDNIITQSW